MKSDLIREVLLGRAEYLKHNTNTTPAVKELLKSPMVAAAIIISTVAVIVTIMVMAPVYFCMLEGFNTVQCLHGFRNG